jgi:hypothetical protein
MSATGLKWLSVLGTLALTVAFGWAVVTVPKPSQAALHPAVVDSNAPAQTLTYVS